MKTKEVRKRFLKLLEKNNHKIIPSAKITPEGDSTTLFVGSGMQPLLPYFLGKEHPLGDKLANSQKCFRANDIDEVGDNRHTTFFEMLGNWSFGDYFKEEQIKQFFFFLTDKDEGIGLDPKRLYVTVFGGDSEFGIERDETSAKVWKELFESISVKAEIADIGTVEEGDKRGMKEGERIFYYGGEKNWWSRSGTPSQMPVGEPGGGDTEVFYDFGEEYGDGSMPHPNSESGRFVEIGNSVFMEYVRGENGFEKLPNKNVDFGGGLERLVSATNNDPDIFKIDIFKKLIDELDNGDYEENPKPYRVVADHLRGAIFMIEDGVKPSNTEAGYVLRRLIRTSVFNLKYKLKKDKHLEDYVDYILNEYEDMDSKNIKSVIEEESNRFEKTIKKGMKELESIDKIDGEKVFYLQSTYGFPKDLTLEILEEKGVSFNEENINKEFDSAMEKHSEVSKGSSDKKFKGGLANSSEKTIKYHTATHLLNQALVDVLGEGVSQKGSNITEERLRFDFSHDKKMTDEEKGKVEDIVNEKIKEALPVTHEDMDIQKAKDMGARGVFEDKYGDVVRVYKIGDFSLEFCGGPHVDNTKDMGVFKIVKEESVSQGVRRIKAVLE